MKGVVNMNIEYKDIHEFKSAELERLYEDRSGGL